MKYKGKTLAHPLTILRRLTFTPFVYILKILLSASLLLGWGIDEAKDFWNNCF